MKVLFLDIDGVLNNLEYRASIANYYENPIDESKLSLIRSIVDRTGALIVLTSTWRLYIDECGDAGKRLDETFSAHGLQISSKTENFDEERDYEILVWLAKNKTDSYVILDDVDFNWCELNRGRFVKVNDTTGITEETVEKAVKILNQ